MYAVNFPICLKIESKVTIMENHTNYYTQIPLSIDDFPVITNSQTKFYLENSEKKHTDELVLSNNSKGGLSNPRAILFLILWYIFSGFTLFLNKYILTYMEGDPTMLGKNISNFFLPMLKFIMKNVFNRCLSNDNDRIVWFHSNVFSVWHVSSQSTHEKAARIL